ncbi:glycosyltransferase family 2 protein [Zunongwangia sp. F363]|uniref:Glycosyltransferase family 2 protein n=1 Tax=Autumnicola tepida TaxID=3075595 RepID=A0ABU3C739_9FLAO|nr:glycosyltransferase family 2 protein [Zunongwangia sp. F363]MDT0642161.1 glycosyltransferase family 2 protein [Zunongwangia sp. F363]
MKHPALVSIIMPAYNAAEFITEAIASVRKQTYTNWELFVIDDSSQDFTVSKVQKLVEEDSRIRILKNTSNKGAGFSRNKGIEAAEGDFIAFLDADDLWKPEKLEKQLEFMISNDVVVCFTSYELIYENGQKKNEIVEALPFLIYQKLLKANYVGNLTGIYKASKIGKIYAPEIRKRQDWALWLKAIEKAGIAKGMLESLAYYRIRRNSVSGNKLEMLAYNFNIYYRVLDFSFWKSFKCMMIFLREQLLIKKRQIKPVK